MSELAEPWESLPRMLQELCEGCPNIRSEIYAYDSPKGHRLWLCANCFGTQKAKDEGRYIG